MPRIAGIYQTIKGSRKDLPLGPSESLQPPCNLNFRLLASRTETNLCYSKASGLLLFALQPWKTNASQQSGQNISIVAGYIQLKSDQTVFINLRVFFFLSTCGLVLPFSSQFQKLFFIVMLSKLQDICRKLHLGLCTVNVQQL